MDAKIENKKVCDDWIWAGIRKKWGGLNSHGEVLSPNDMEDGIIHFIDFSPTCSNSARLTDATLGD